jgi:hypothetical protein
MAKKKSQTRTVYITKSRRRARPGFTLPLAALAGFTPMVMELPAEIKAKGLISGVAQTLSTNLVGYNPWHKTWNVGYAASHCWFPVLAGILVHKMAGKLGINRALARAGVPIIRI